MRKRLSKLQGGINAEMPRYIPGKKGGISFREYSQQMKYDKLCFGNNEDDFNDDADFAIAVGPSPLKRLQRPTSSRAADKLGKMSIHQQLQLMSPLHPKGYRKGGERNDDDDDFSMVVKPYPSVDPWYAQRTASSIRADHRIVRLETSLLDDSDEDVDVIKGTSGISSSGKRNMPRRSAKKRKRRMSDDMEDGYAPTDDEDGYAPTDNEDGYAPTDGEDESYASVPKKRKKKKKKTKALSSAATKASKKKGAIIHMKVSSSIRQHLL